MKRISTPKLSYDAAFSTENITNASILFCGAKLDMQGFVDMTFVLWVVMGHSDIQPILSFRLNLAVAQFH